jgi:lipid-A-disaccharide synthase
MTKEGKKYNICILAGEPSGDLIGAKLIRALRNTGHEFDIFGVGGREMEREGLKSFFDIKDIAIMGYTEVITSIPRIFKRIRTTVQECRNHYPSLVITIDSPGFNFRVVKRLRQELRDEIPILHYVAPTVWAYKPERAKIVASLYDHLFLLLPFEKKYFDEVGVGSTFVGHHIGEDLANISLLTDEERDVITIMPGSRKQELKLHLPIIKEVITKLKEKYGTTYRFFIPTVNFLEWQLEQMMEDMPDVIISSDPKIKKDMMSHSAIALTKSGTATVELMAYSVPQVVFYKVSGFSAWYIRSKLKIKNFCIANLLLGKEVVPELIQENCTVEKIFTQVSHLLDDPEARAYQKEYFTKAMKMLRFGQCPTPSEIVAQKIIELLV